MLEILQILGIVAILAVILALALFPWIMMILISRNKPSDAQRRHVRKTEFDKAVAREQAKLAAGKIRDEIANRPTVKGQTRDHGGAGTLYGSLGDESPEPTIDTR